jgi:hypothetical protein
MSDLLRERIQDLDFTHFEVRLPGDTDGAPLEGAITLEESPDGDGWRVTTVDYGQHWVLDTADTRNAAEELLLAYLSRPLPPKRDMEVGEVDSLVSAVSMHYFDLRDRATAAGNAGVVFDMPPGVMLDRLGAIDGIRLYPLDTPWELRSLPPHTLREESGLHHFVTAGVVRMRATITPPWFGHPGGGLLFTTQAPRLGVRDYVVAGDIQQVNRIR